MVSQTKRMMAVLRSDISTINAYTSAMDMARRAFLDYLASYLSALKIDRNQILIHSLAISEDEIGYQRLLGTSLETSEERAGLLYGHLAHFADLDDVQANFRGHPSATIFSALLAISNPQDSFEKFLQAYVQGVEFAGRLGLQFNPMHLSKGWHSTATIGSMAAGVAIGYYENLSEGDFARLLSLISSQAAGFIYQEGTDGKPLQAGFAARNAVQAYRLTKLGLSSYGDIFSDQKGWPQIIFGHSLDFDLFISNWLEEPQIISPGLWFKKQAFCSAATSGYDLGLLAFQSGLDWKKITQVEVHFSKTGDKALSYRFPKTKLEGKFSIEYILWLVLSRGVVKDSDFEEVKPESDFYRFAKKIIRFNDLPAQPSERPTRLVIRTKDGIIFDETVKHPKGSPLNPLSEEEHFEKFQSLTKGAFEKSYHLIRAMSIQTINELMDEFQ